MIDTQQAWQQDRLDIAEHFFAKLTTDSIRPRSVGAEECIELFLEIGKDNFDKKNIEQAAKWLERASAMLQEHHLEENHNATGLRLNVLHAYGQSLGLVTCHTNDTV